MMPKQNKPRNIKYIPILGILVILFYVMYASVASNGYLGDEAKSKYLQQSSSSLGLLISGRTEVVSEFFAISKSPLIGYGSYAPLTEEIREKVVTVLSENGINPTLKELKYGTDYRIPVHSGIFEFWLWFGILGIPFFVLIIFDSLTLVNRGNLSPVAFFLVLQIVWDSIFSPFAADRRIQFPLTILLISNYLSNYIKKTS